MASRYMSSNTRDRKACQQNYYKGQQLGEGLYGSVFEVCEGKPCKRNQDSPYIVKISLLSKPRQKKIDPELLYNAYHDYYYMKKLQRTKIVPKVYDWWICEEANVAFLVMERMDRTFFSLLQDQEFGLTDEQQDRINHMFKTLQRYGIVHDDFRAVNLMYKEQDGQLYLIDFGRAGDFTWHKNPISGERYQMVPYSFRGTQQFYKTKTQVRDIVRYWDRVLMEVFFAPPFAYTLFIEGVVPTKVYDYLAQVRYDLYQQ